AFSRSACRGSLRLAGSRLARRLARRAHCRAAARLGTLRAATRLLRDACPFTRLRTEFSSAPRKPAATTSPSCGGHARWGLMGANQKTDNHHEPEAPVRPTGRR